MTRPQTSISRSTKGLGLPELQRPSSKISGSRTVQPEEIMEMKNRINQMEEQRKILRAKIQRMRKTIQNRDVSIKKVLSQPQKQQSIQTATPGGLQRLRAERSSLSNALASRQQELDSLLRSDKLAFCDELKIEIPLFYQEKIRLQDEYSESKRMENILTEELNRIQQQIQNASYDEKAVDEFQLEIDDLTEKYFAYKKSAMKLDAAKDIHKIQSKKKTIDEIISKLESEINDVKDEIDKTNQETEEIQENEKKNIDYLNSIIEDQIDRIKKSLHSLYHNDIEEDVIEEEEEDD